MQQKISPAISALAQALFLSPISFDASPNPRVLFAAINTVWATMPRSEVVAAVAYEYGAYPETAVPRMRAALAAATRAMKIVGPRDRLIPVQWIGGAA